MGRPPPDVPAAVAVYLEVLEDLRAKPDSWAQLATYPSSMGAVGAAKSLRLALANLDLGRFEFVTRRGGSGGALYGKYLGA